MAELILRRPISPLPSPTFSANHGCAVDGDQFNAAAAAVFVNMSAREARELVELHLPRMAFSRFGKLLGSTRAKIRRAQKLHDFFPGGLNHGFFFGRWFDSPRLHIGIAGKWLRLWLCLPKHQKEHPATKEHQHKRDRRCGKGNMGGSSHVDSPLGKPDMISHPQRGGQSWGGD